MSQILKDKVAAVTGAGRGLGKAVALELAGQGAKVVVNDFGGEKDGSGGSASPADEVVAEIKEQGGEAVANYGSVADPEGGESVINSAVETFGKIDILANVAGIMRDRMIFNMTDEDWDMVVKVHLYGHFYCTRAACILMKKQKSGRIINVTSLAAFGNPGQTAYGAAKAGIIGFTKTVALEMSRSGVTCNAMIPSAATRMTRSPEMRTAWERRAAQGDPMAKEVLAGWDGRAPEDNGPLFAYLASDYAGGVSGKVFYVKEGEISLYNDYEIVKTIHKSRRWTVEELVEFMPQSLAKGMVNPSPSPEKGKK